MFAVTDDIETWKLKLMDPATPYGALSYGIVIAFIAWLVGRTLALGFQRLMEKPRHIHLPADRTAIRFLAQLARLGVYFFAFMTYAHLVPALHEIGTAWLASVGVVSVVLGLAAQNTLGNLIAGISLLLYRPFNLGDRLQVTAPTGVETGEVESLNLGYTVLLTGDNRRIVIPNSLMASQTNINLSKSNADERKMCSVPIRLAHTADVDKARAILVDIAKAHPLAPEYDSCPVTKLGKRSVTLMLKMWCAHSSLADGLKNDVLEAAKKRFEKEGIEMFKPPRRA